MSAVLAVRPFIQPVLSKVSEAGRHGGAAVAQQFGLSERG